MRSKAILVKPEWAFNRLAVKSLGLSAGLVVDRGLAISAE
jgi:hypothetical protein